MKFLSISIPKELEQTAPSLNIYAVDTRYPDNYFIVDTEDYQEALDIAQKVYDWANATLHP